MQGGSDLRPGLCLFPFSPERPFQRVLDMGGDREQWNTGSLSILILRKLVFVGSRNNVLDLGVLWSYWHRLREPHNQDQGLHLACH